RMFVAGDADEHGIQIDAVDEKAFGRQPPGMLTGSACDIEHGSRGWIQPAQGSRNRRHLMAVILDRRIQQVVVLGCLAEHDAAVSPGSSGLSRCNSQSTSLT